MAVDLGPRLGGRPAVVFPPRKARVVVGVLRCVCAALLMGGALMVSTERLLAFDLVEFGGTVAASWVAAVLLTLAGFVLWEADAASIAVSTAGITFRRRLVRTNVPWAAVASLARSVTALEVTDHGGERHLFPVVAKEAAGRFAWSTSPTAKLLDDLELFRRTAVLDTTGSARITVRRALPPRGDVVQLVALAVVLVAVAVLRTAGLIS